MSAQIQRRRNKTARELSKKFGISERTVRTMIAEPREDFIARANKRRQEVSELRAKGLSVRAIAEELGISKSTAGRYVQEYESKNN
ncbi:helix-turn-helix domain-containing protein [Rothia nasimurium]|uniref:helix-turn-helix domain-containing protein n=1 Tax=Rothia nasimurium TaxID=85336 RepID=UPI001F337D1D|nr:helix-turn-helix domain-containing protein [Rothia nasimurium]